MTNMKKIITTISLFLFLLTASAQLKIDHYEMHHKKDYQHYHVDGTITFSEDSITSYIHCPELTLNVYDLENYNGYFIGYLKGSKRPVIIYRHGNMIFITWKNYSYRLHIKE